MHILVTGAGGFVGRHAVQELLRHGHTVAAISGPGHQSGTPGVETFNSIDLRDSGAVELCIRQAKPDACLHLAGIAFVPEAWANPQNAFTVNTIATINLLESLRAHAPACRMLAVTSAQIYGHKVRSKEISEEDSPDIESIYAASKWAADVSTLLYTKRHQMHTMTARPCNHIGPGQSESFAVSSFARQLLEFSLARRTGEIRVGNLESEREFTDVRDVVAAYRLLLEKGQAGKAYNITSGKFYRIRAVFDSLCRIIGVQPQIEIDPELYRPTDTQPRLNIARLAADTGWKPSIPLETTLNDIVADFRARMGA